MVKNRDDVQEAAKLFSVPDFIGDCCKAIASRVRGAVASVKFDDFHKVGLRELSTITASGGGGGGGDVEMFHDGTNFHCPHRM